MMCALFLSKKPTHKETISDRMMNWLQRKYQPLLEKAIRIKYWLVGITVAIFAFSLFYLAEWVANLYHNYRKENLPLNLICQRKFISQSIETSMQASRIIKEFDEVKMVVGKTGAAEVPTDPMPPEATDLMVILKPQSEWKSQELMMN
jgi:cobalt-zinc-cadmium resistance protein CzcA